MQRAADRGRRHRKQEAPLLAQGAFAMQACLEDREDRDTAVIDAACRSFKDARVGRAEHEWAARHAHTSPNSRTRAPNDSAPQPPLAPRASTAVCAARYPPGGIVSAHEKGAAREVRRKSRHQTAPFVRSPSRLCSLNLAYILATPFPFSIARRAAPAASRALTA